MKNSYSLKKYSDEQVSDLEKYYLTIIKEGNIYKFMNVKAFGEDNKDSFISTQFRLYNVNNLYRIKFINNEKSLNVSNNQVQLTQSGSSYIWNFKLISKFSNQNNYNIMSFYKILDSLTRNNNVKLNNLNTNTNYESINNPQKYYLDINNNLNYKLVDKTNKSDIKLKNNLETNITTFESYKIVDEQKNSINFDQKSI